MRSPEGKNPSVPTRESPDGKSGSESTRTPSGKRHNNFVLPDNHIDMSPVIPPLLEKGTKSDKKTEEIRAFELGQDTWGGIDDEQGSDSAVQSVQADGATQTEMVNRLLDQTRIGKGGKKERPVAQLSDQDKAALADYIRRLPKRSETPPPAAPPPTDQGVLGKIKKLFGR